MALVQELLSNGLASYTWRAENRSFKKIGIKISFTDNTNIACAQLDIKNKDEQIMKSWMWPSERPLVSNYRAATATLV
jgi:hypothetical protein